MPRKGSDKATLSSGSLWSKMGRGCDGSRRSAIVFISRKEAIESAALTYKEEDDQGDRGWPKALRTYVEEYSAARPRSATGQWERAALG